MAKWTSSKRHDWDENNQCTKRWIVHLDGEDRGICECWEEGDAERIAAALNDGKAEAASAIAALIKAGDILAETVRNLVGADGDIGIENLVQLENALQFWRIISEANQPTT